MKNEINENEINMATQYILYIVNKELDNIIEAQQKEWDKEKEIIIKKILDLQENEVNFKKAAEERIRKELEIKIKKEIKNGRV